MAGVTEEGQGSQVWDYITGQGQCSNSILQQQALKEVNGGLAILIF